MPSTYGGVRDSMESESDREDDEVSLSSVVKGAGQATLLSSSVKYVEK
jgi:hypothetical protein